MLNFCGGGETLLPPEMPQIVEECLKTGNYVTIVTNGTATKRFEQLAQLDPELLKHLFIKFSFQYLELKRLNMLERYAENVIRMKNTNCSISVEITPNDELVPYIEEVKAFSMEKFGALPHITIARVNTDPQIKILTNYTKDEYKKIWETFDSKMFEFKLPLYEEKRKEYCYAGDWTLYINIDTGTVKQCYSGKNIDNIYNDINKSIKYCPIGCKCKEPHCYNAHSFLLFGAIPNFSEVTYADIRNRKCSDNTEWLKPEVKEFFSSKLNETNNEYTCIQKIKAKIKNKLKI